MKHRKVFIGDATLYLGDCLEVMAEFEAGNVDAVVADPPYGIGHKHSGKSKGKWGRVISSPITGDDQLFDPTPFIKWPCSLFGADHFASKLPPHGIFHVWDKECGRSGRVDSFSDAELMWISLPGKRQVKRYLWKGLQVEEPNKDQRREHPTQKPIAVMEWCIKFFPKARTILDPFMGSGTTGVACCNLGRKFIGIEIEEKYFDIACRRIEMAASQVRMEFFAPEKPEQIDLGGIR